MTKPVVPLDPAAGLAAEAPEEFAARPARGGDAATLARLLAARHSCRAFLSTPVPRETIEEAFRMAQQAASWCNSQAWQVHLASGAAVERLRSVLLAAAQSGTEETSAAQARGTRAHQPATDFPFPSEYTGTYLERRRECGLRLYTAVGIERGDRGGYARQTLENFRLFGAPHHAVLTSDPGLGTYGAVDVGGYAQLLLLCLQSLGIAAIAQAAVSQYSALLKDTLDIPRERLVVCGISFGYEDTAHPVNGFRTPRAGLSEVVAFRETDGRT